MATEKRLIYMEDAKEALIGWETDPTDEEIEYTLDHLPKVDAVEVVHGHWRYYSTTMQECSNCQRHTARHKFKYCPHCGAVMEDKYYESTD